MSRLRDFYVGLGHEAERLGNDTWYLTELSLSAAIEVDNYLLDRSDDFSHLRELSQILAQYQLKDTDNALSTHFPFLELWHGVTKGSEKRIMDFSSLALEMRLLRSELDDIPQLSVEGLESMRSCLVNISKSFHEDKGYSLLQRSRIA